jgi:hypothetical protein
MTQMNTDFDLLWCVAPMLNYSELLPDSVEPPPS